MSGFQAFSKMAPDPKGVETTNLIQLLDFTDRAQKIQFSAPGDRANYMSPSKGGWDSVGGGGGHRMSQQAFSISNYKIP